MTMYTAVRNDTRRKLSRRHKRLFLNQVIGLHICALVRKCAGIYSFVVEFSCSVELFLLEVVTSDQRYTKSINAVFTKLINCT